MQLGRSLRCRSHFAALRPGWHLLLSDTDVAPTALFEVAELATLRTTNSLVQARFVRLPYLKYLLEPCGTLLEGLASAMAPALARAHGDVAAHLAELVINLFDADQLRGLQGDKKSRRLRVSRSRTTAPLGFSSCTANGTSAQLVASSGRTTETMSCGAWQSGRGPLAITSQCCVPRSNRQRRFALGPLTWRFRDDCRFRARVNPTVLLPCPASFSSKKADLP